MSLHMAEVFALQRALQDPDFRVALTQFFVAQSDAATVQSCAAMNQRPAQIEAAIAFAAQAQAAQESFNKLEEFTRQQLSQQ